MIELVHLEKKYENAVPLDDVNAIINDGEVISVIGPSGTGKSTLIRCIDMLERPTGGKIILDGENICDPGYEPNSDYTACVECSNRRVNGEIAVSGYIYECEIAACMYQGQKYALQMNECVPICENESDDTGTKVWDERTKKCIRTCNPGYKMW